MQSQRTQIENSCLADASPEGDVPAMDEFHTRLEDLRKALQSQCQPKSEPKPVTSRIRRLAWLSSVFVFFAVLFIRWNSQAAELPGNIFLSVVASAIFVALAELVILVLFWALKNNGRESL